MPIVFILQFITKVLLCVDQQLSQIQSHIMLKLFYCQPTEAAPYVICPSCSWLFLHKWCLCRIFLNMSYNSQELRDTSGKVCYGQNTQHKITIPYFKMGSRFSCFRCLEYQIHTCVHYCQVCEGHRHTHHIPRCPQDGSKDPSPTLLVTGTQGCQQILHETKTIIT